jgi:hypothetical protein
MVVGAAAVSAAGADACSLPPQADRDTTARARTLAMVAFNTEVLRRMFASGRGIRDAAV